MHRTVATSEPATYSTVTTSEADEFLTVADVARTLRLSKMSVYRLIHAGELEAHRFGRSFRVLRSAVDGLLKNSLISHG